MDYLINVNGREMYRTNVDYAAKTLFEEARKANPVSNVECWQLVMESPGREE